MLTYNIVTALQAVIRKQLNMTAAHFDPRYPSNSLSVVVEKLCVGFLIVAIKTQETIQSYTAVHFPCLKGKEEVGRGCHGDRYWES